MTAHYHITDLDAENALRERLGMLRAQEGFGPASERAKTVRTVMQHKHCAEEVFSEKPRQQFRHQFFKAFGEKF